MDVTLETPRLLLRQPRPADAPRIARLINNFAVSGKLARVPYPYKLGAPTSRRAKPASPSTCRARG